MPAAALSRPAPTPGSYSCRVVSLGRSAKRGPAFERFKPFFCYIDLEGDLFTIVKQTGSQRPAGRLWHDQNPTRLIFLGSVALGSEDEARTRLARWLEKYRLRVVEDWEEGNDEARFAAMKAVNPKFIPRSWVLDELIERVEKKGEREVLDRVMHMALNPFEEEYKGEGGEQGREEYERFCGDVPRYQRAMQCSCSS